MLGSAPSMTCCVSSGKATPSLVLICPIWQTEMTTAALLTSENTQSGQQQLHFNVGFP